MNAMLTKRAIQVQLAKIIGTLGFIYIDDNDKFGHRADEKQDDDNWTCDIGADLEALECEILTLNILKTYHEDRVAIARALHEERMAIQDRQLAVRLASLQANHTDIETADSTKIDIDEDLSGADEHSSIDKELLAAQIHQCFKTGKPGGRTKNGSSTGLPVSGSTNKCHACLDVVVTGDTITLTCEPEAHTYCRSCITDFFKSAMADSTMFPPQCCKVPIPVDLCHALLPKDLVKAFDIKSEELTTPNPTYCSNRQCGAYIQEKHIRHGVGSCVFCREGTCTACKTKVHSGLCPSDPHVQLLMDTAKRSKWQQCGHCKNMVELSVGCFHMKCRCSYEFCYLCAMRWKQCSCPLYQENYIITRPLEDALNLGPLEAPAADQAPANARARGLRRNVHLMHTWTRQNDGTCQYCDADYLPWVMRCVGCPIQACWRCIDARF